MRDVPSIRSSEDPGRIVTWQPAAPPRTVEGPLALDCFEDRCLVLELACGQLACREDDGRLQQVFLDGIHRLEIGRAAGQTAPTGRLTFLRPDVPIDLRWRRDDHLVLDASGAADRVGRAPATGAPDHGLSLPLRGACRLVLADPVLFFGSVLQGLQGPCGDSLHSVLDALVRAQLAEHLHPLLRGRDLNRVHAQTLLGGLEPADLGDDLAEIGLDCLHLTAYLPLEQDRQPDPQPVAAAPPGSYDDLL